MAPSPSLDTLFYLPSSPSFHLYLSKPWSNLVLKKPPPKYTKESSDVIHAVHLTNGIQTKESTLRLSTVTLHNNLGIEKGKEAAKVD
jgi:hypothetical protein